MSPVDGAEGAIRLEVDGVTIVAAPGQTLAAAMLSAGLVRFRESVTGEPRAPLCGMGVCFECRVSIDGVAGRRACMVPASGGMVVSTGETHS